MPSAVTYRAHTVGELELFVREAGSPDSPTVVFLPGFPSSSAQYEPLIERLRGSVRCVAPDYPGFGHSATPPSAEFDYTFDALADQTARLLLDELGLEQFWLYMFDFGAPVGMRIAERYPEHVAGLIIQNANAYTVGLGDLMTPVVGFRDDPGRESAIRQFLEIDVTRMQYFSGAGDIEKVNPDAPEVDQALMEYPNRKDAFTELLRDYANNLDHYPAWQAYLEKHQPPTLIFWGRNDGFFPEEGAHAYLEQLPDAEVHIADSGHFAATERPDELASLIQSFVARHDPRTGPATVTAATFYAHIAAGRVPDAVATLGDVVDWYGVHEGIYTSPSRPWHGSGEVAAHVLEPMVSATSDLTLVNHVITDHGKIAVMSGSYNGKNEATGTVFSVPYSHVWRVDADGQPVEVRIFTDAGAFGEAMRTE